MEKQNTIILNVLFALIGNPGFSPSFAFSCRYFNTQIEIRQQATCPIINPWVLNGWRLILSFRVISVIVNAMFKNAKNPHSLSTAPLT